MLYCYYYYYYYAIIIVVLFLYDFTAVVVVDAAIYSRSFVGRNNNNNNINNNEFYKQNHKYDRSITTFDPNGRLLQVEYSYEATKRGDTSIACGIFEHDEINTNDNDDDDDDDTRSEEYLCLAITTAVTDSKRSFVSRSSSSSSNSVSDGIVHRIDDTIFICTVGLNGDSLWIINHLRTIVCPNYKLMYGETISVKHVAEYIAQNIQHELTKTSGSRPLGCTCIVLGFNNNNNNNMNNMSKQQHQQPQLYRVNPGGVIENCWYCSAGKQNESIMNALQKRYRRKNSSSSSSSSSRNKRSNTATSSTSTATPVVNNEEVGSTTDHIQQQQQQQQQEYTDEVMMSSNRISNSVRTVVKTLLGSFHDVFGNNAIIVPDRNSAKQHSSDDTTRSLSSLSPLSSSSTSMTDLWIFRYNPTRRGQVQATCFINVNDDDDNDDDDETCLMLLSNHFRY